MESSRRPKSIKSHFSLRDHKLFEFRKKEKKNLKVAILLILFGSYITVNRFYNTTLTGKIIEVSLIVLVSFSFGLLVFKRKKRK